jgi:hypothetical protein
MGVDYSPEAKRDRQAQGVNSADDVIFGDFFTDDTRMKNPNTAQIMWNQLLTPPDFIQN